MKILTYLQIRERLAADLPEASVQKILTVTGRAEEWLDPVVKLIAENASLSEVDVVERSGMGRSLMQQVPSAEWVYLVNPSMADPTSYVTKQQIVVAGKLWSLSFAKWILAQESGKNSLLTTKDLTDEEARLARLLWVKQESVVEREEIAQVLWGSVWEEKHSDWAIDAVVHRMRKKLAVGWQLVTIKGRGYMLVHRDRSSRAMSVARQAGVRISEIPFSIYPSAEYLEYMNDPSRVRKVYADLWNAAVQDRLKIPNLSGKRILSVNSYSYDNVDSIVTWIKERRERDVKIYFAHYDPNALALHAARIEELGVGKMVEVVYDDLRESRLIGGSMALVINDFRLNFNQSDKQNMEMMRHIRRVLEPGGVALVSTVVDERYEHKRYGEDQEKAPVNKIRPGIFQADEHLVRRCWSVPYYKQLFDKSGFGQVREFDIIAGKSWNPCYRRWWLR